MCNLTNITLALDYDPRTRRKLRNHMKTKQMSYNPFLQIYPSSQMWSVQYGSSQYTGKLMNHMKTKRMSDSRCPPTRSQASVTYVISDQSGHNYIPVTIRWSDVYKYVCPAGSAWLGGWARGTPDSPPLNSIAHPCIPQLCHNPYCPTPPHTHTPHTP